MFSILSYPARLIHSFIKQNEPSCSFELEQEITYELENKFKAKTQKQPVLILVGGFQGSGKSSLIMRIKEIYDANVISTDVIRQSLFNKGIRITPEFSKYVKSIYINLVKKYLSMGLNIFIDANAHSKRIDEIEKLVKENSPHYLIIKIFLNTAEATLRNRVKNRKPTADCYQGTESDLETALASTKINLEDYDFSVDTDELSESTLFERVNKFISPYFSLQNPSNLT